MFPKGTLKSLWNPVEALLEAQQAQEKDSTITPDRLLRQLKLQVSRRLGSPYPGEYRGLFKGQGLDLLNLREYQPGDDIRKIDWNVLARTGVPHIKEYYAEKQIPVWVVVDATETMHFGQMLSKLAYAVQLVGLLGLLALEEGHRVGLLVWDGVETPVRCIPPGNSVPHLQWLIQQVETMAHTDAISFQPGENKQFPPLNRIFKNRCLVFCLSDFAFIEDVPEAASILAQVGRKHQLQSLVFIDPAEEQLSEARGWLPLAAPAGQPRWVNTADRMMVRRYQQCFQEQIATRRKQLLDWGGVQLVNTGNEPSLLLQKLANAS